MMAVIPIAECFSRDLGPEYCHGLESSAVLTAPPYFVQSLRGHSCMSLPRLPLHMHAKEVISTCLMSNIYLGLFRPKALTLQGLWSYELIEGLQIVRKNISVGLLEILNFPAPKRRIPVLAGDRDYSQGGSSVASTMQGQNSNPSSALNNSRFADMTQRVTSTASTALGRSINTPTTTLGISSRSTRAPRRTSQTASS